MAEPEVPETEPRRDDRRTDHSPWNWLLLVPIVIPLITPLFNHDSPRLLGFPMFYWLQFAFLLLGVGATATVYNVTKQRKRVK